MLLALNHTVLLCVMCCMLLEYYKILDVLAVGNLQLRTVKMFTSAVDDGE
jgi:hypothetical protein